MKAMEQSWEHEENLTKLLKGEIHSLLLRLIDVENEIGSTLALENFILGFRLESQLILEALDEDAGSLVELLAEMIGGRNKATTHPIDHASPATQIKDKNLGGENCNGKAKTVR